MFIPTGSWERAGADFQMKRIHFPGQRNVLPVCLQFAHFDRHLFSACPTASEPSAKGVDQNPVALAFLQQEPAHATAGVSASFHFAAIRVEDSHKGGGIRRARFRRFDDQQFITAHPCAPVADPNDFCHRWSVRLYAPVHNNKIVAQAVHLNKRSTARDDTGLVFGKRDGFIHRVGVLY
jgi:hypothetical protein